MENPPSASLPRLPFESGSQACEKSAEVRLVTARNRSHINDCVRGGGRSPAKPVFAGRIPCYQGKELGVQQTRRIGSPCRSRNSYTNQWLAIVFPCAGE